MRQVTFEDQKLPERLINQTLANLSDPWIVYHHTDPRELESHILSAHGFYGYYDQARASPDASLRLLWSLNMSYPSSVHEMQNILGPFALAYEFNHTKPNIKMYRRERFGCSMDKVNFYKHFDPNSKNEINFRSKFSIPAPCICSCRLLTDGRILHSRSCPR